MTGDPMHLLSRTVLCPSKIKDGALLIANRRFGSQNSFSPKGGFGALTVCDSIRCHGGRSRSFPERRG